MKGKSSRDERVFDFERIVYNKLKEMAGMSGFIPYRGKEGVYYFLGFHFRLKREQAKRLLASMGRRGLIKIRNRGIKIN